MNDTTHWISVMQKKHASILMQRARFNNTGCELFSETFCEGKIYCKSTNNLSEFQAYQCRLPRIPSSGIVYGFHVSRHNVFSIRYMYSLQGREAKNLTLSSGTSPYGPHKVVPPPGGGGGGAVSK